MLLASCGSSDDDASGAADPEPADAVDDSADEEAVEDDPAESEPPAEEADGVDLTSELFPDVLDAVATLDGDGSWTFSAPLSSPYDSPERYADAWRVMGADGEVYGIRELTHDHASEQPFTRSHSGINIPDDVSVVTVQGRDQVSGWGGETVEVELVR